MFDRIRAQLVRKVVNDWPRTLEEWDRHEAEAEVMLAHRLGAYTGHIDQRLPEPAAAIRFAEEFKCLEILPAAFLLLSCIEHTSKGEDEYTVPRTARRELLHSGDFDRILRGRDKFVAFIEGLDTKQLCDLSFDPCDWPTEKLDPWPTPLPANFEQFPCRTVRWRIAERLVTNVSRQNTYNPLLDLKKILGWVETDEAKVGLAPGTGLCRTCMQNLERWVLYTRTDFWRCLVWHFAPECRYL